MNLINQVQQRPECSYEWCHNIEMPQVYRYTSMKLCMHHYRVHRNLECWNRKDLQLMLDFTSSGGHVPYHDLREAKFCNGVETNHTCTNIRYPRWSDEKCGGQIYKLHDGTLMCGTCYVTYILKKPESLPPLFKCKFCNSGLLIFGCGKRVCVNCRSEFELITENTENIQTFVLVTTKRNF